MARAYQCDRCGAFYARGSMNGLYEVKTRMVDRCQDLCPKCSEELEKWMQKEADFVPKEVEESDVQPDV